MNQTASSAGYQAFGLVLATMILFAPAARGAEDSPYVVDKKVFRQQVQTVAVAPLDFPYTFQISDTARRSIEAEIESLLRKRKLTVVPISNYRTVRDTMTRQVGGISDSDGKPVVDRQLAVWEHSKREMKLRHAFDAIVYPSILPVRAAFKDDRAEWDGVKQKVKSRGGGFLGGKDYQGTIAAASFRLAIFDRNDDLMFVDRGGIEVLQHRVKAQLLPLPFDTVLQDEKKLRKGLQLAFKEL